MIYKIIKWLVPFFMALVLYKKFFQNPDISLEKIKVSIMGLEWHWLPFLIVMSIVNWGIETRKWQYLICKLEIQPFKVAMKSVLCGVTVAQMLPYRTGEYLGRLAYVRDEQKLEAGVLSVIGSFSQLLITLVFGLVGLLLFPLTGFDTFNDLDAYLVFSALGLVLLFLAYYHLPKTNFLLRWPLFKSIHHALKLLKPSDVRRLLGFSCLRYFSFLLPYALLIVHYDLARDNSLALASISVACIYLLQTAFPSFILTDIAVRVSIPVLVLTGTFDNVRHDEYLPGMIVYVFNVVVPMLMGAFVLITLKLKK